MIIRKTNAELEEILAGLDKLSADNIFLPVGVSYRIIKNKLEIQQALLPYRVTKDDIVNKYSNGVGKISQNDDPELFNKVCCDISKIAGETIEADISTVSVSEISEKELPISVVSSLEFMITEY